MTTIPASSYSNADGEPITFAESARILDEVYDVGHGIQLFCESRLQMKYHLTMEESASLAFIALGIEKLLSGIVQVTPDAPGKKEG